MKRVILFVLLCVANFNVANAQLIKSLKAKVGKQPVAIIPARQYVGGLEVFAINPDTLNIICLGYDANFNGEFDEEDGDELPSWWKIERVVNANPLLTNPQPFKVRKVMDFDMNWGGFFPFRNRVPENVDIFPAVFQESLLPIASADRVTYYNMSTEKPTELEFIDSNIKSVCSHSKWFFTTRRVYENPGNWMPSANVLTMYDVDNFEKVFSYESPNENIQRVIAINVHNNSMVIIAVLYEGEYGSPDGSTIEFHTSKMPLNNMTSDMEWENCFDIKEIKVGSNANDMVLFHPVVYNLPWLFVVSSADNRIYIVNGATQKFYDNYIQLPCEVPNSIREISIQIDYNNSLVSATISSYDGNLYYIEDVFSSIDFEDEENRIFPSDGILSDASCLFGTIRNHGWGGIGLLFARTFNTNDMYQPEDEVEIFYMSSLGIAENNNVLKIFPNPVENIINIELEEMSEIISIRLIDNEGKYLQALTNYSIDGNTIQINLPEIQTGSYFIEIKTKEGSYIQKFIAK